MNRSTHIRSGLPSSLSALKARRVASITLRWIVAFLLILLVGRMAMDDEIVAAKMAEELNAAVVTLNAKPACEALTRRVTHTTAEVANQCRTGAGSGE
jgi:predicted secreted Zn-dependent protease